MRAVVNVRQLMRRRMRGSPAAGECGSAVVARAVDNRGRGRIAVVNIRQETFYRCDKHPE